MCTGMIQRASGSVSQSVQQQLSCWLALTGITSSPVPVATLSDEQSRDMNKNNKNAETATNKNVINSNLTEEFGDVNQYKELDAIGTGEFQFF